MSKIQRLALVVGIVGATALPCPAQQPFKPILPRFSTPAPATTNNDPQPSSRQPDTIKQPDTTKQPPQNQPTGGVPSWQNQNQLPALSGGYVGGSPGASPLVRQLQTRPLQRYLEYYERNFSQPNFNTPFLNNPSSITPQIPTYPAYNSPWTQPVPAWNQNPWAQPNPWNQNAWNQNPWVGPMANNWNNQLVNNPWGVNGPAFPLGQNAGWNVAPNTNLGWFNGMNPAQPPFAAAGYGNPLAALFNNAFPGLVR